MKRIYFLPLFLDMLGGVTGTGRNKEYAISSEQFLPLPRRTSREEDPQPPSQAARIRRPPLQLQKPPQSDPRIHRRPSRKRRYGCKKFLGFR